MTKYDISIYHQSIFVREKKEQVLTESLVWFTYLLSITLAYTAYDPFRCTKEI